MSDDQHTTFRENIPAHALGALTAEEAAALEAHIETCASCRTELADYRAVSDGLLTAVPPQRPSNALRARLQGRLPSAQKVSKPRWTWSFGQLVLGAALVFLLALNLIAFAQMQALQKQQARLLQQMQDNQTVLAMISYPSVRTFPLSGEEVSGTLLLDEERNTVAFIIWDLPRLSEDQVYQAWLIQPNEERVSAGLFHAQSDQPFTTEAIFSDQDLSAFVGLGVTIEPAGGSRQPTGQRVFKVDF